jgi:hypothetical protein
MDHDEINVLQTDYVLETFDTLSHVGVSENAISYLSSFFISHFKPNTPKGSKFLIISSNFQGPVLNSAGELLGIVMDIDYI